MPTKTEISALIKEYNATRNERLKIQAEADKKEQREKAILDALTAAKITSGKYGAYEVTVNTKKVPRVTDWQTFHAYIRENNAFELLHKRVTESAAMERINEGELLPGCVTDDKVSYKFTLA